MRRMALALALLSACAAAPAGPQERDLRASGTWEVFLWLEGQERPSGGQWVHLRCEGGVQTVLDDADGTINGGFIRGTLACWFGDDPNPRAVDWASPISGTHDLDTGHIELRDGYCDYTGRMDGADRMAGTVRCNTDSGSTQLDLNGTWEATS